MSRIKKPEAHKNTSPHYQGVDVVRHYFNNRRYHQITLRIEEEEGGRSERLKHDHTPVAVKRNNLAALLPETGIFFTRPHQFEDLLI